MIIVSISLNGIQSKHYKGWSIRMEIQGKLRLNREILFQKTNNSLHEDN